MKKIIWIMVAAFSLCLNAETPEAKNIIVLNPLFQPGAVLQRDKVIPVWGIAPAGAFLELSLAGHKTFTRVSGSGKFMARFPALPAGGPYELTVTDRSNGTKISIDNVLIGEVWLASGQSNMMYPLNADWRPEKKAGELLSRKQEKEFCEAVKNLDQLRFFSVDKGFGPIPQESLKGKWQELKAPYAAQASAVAAWFALNMRQTLKVPVGVIISAYGGTTAEAWTSREGLLADPTSTAWIEEYDRELAKEQCWRDTLCPGKPMVGAVADTGNRGVKNGWATIGFDDSDWKEMTVPGSWISQKISGNGAVWFRKSVDLPESWANVDLYLEIPGIDKQDITYFNGVEIGRTGSGLDSATWNAPRRYKVPAKLVRQGKNVIAIRAYSFSSNGGFFGVAEKHRLIAGEKQFPLAGIWKAEPELDLGILPACRQVYPFHPLNRNSPSHLFNHMLNPLLPYAIRGVIWYQGESNADTVDEARAYRQKMKALICDWRYRWGERQLPFIQVQLAGFEHLNNAQPWPYLRESQRLVCGDLPGVYAVSAMDVGDAHDIHPQDKKTVGFRLAACALHHVYHHTQIVPCGPQLSGCQRENNELKVLFHYSDALELRGNHPEAAFEIAGNDGIYHPAERAEIKNGVLFLSSSKVPFPCAARYAWKNFPQCVLYNRAGFPASSFDSRNQ